MITHPIVTDLARMASREAQSALPSAPVVAEPVRQGRVMPAVRLQVTAALRWLADALEPAPAAKPTSGC